MNSSLQYMEMVDFSGGLNLENPSFIQDNQLSVLKNAVFTPSGQIRVRPGITHLGGLDIDSDEGSQVFVGAFKFDDFDGSGDDIEDTVFFFSTGIFGSDGTLLKDHYAYGTDPKNGVEQYALVYAGEVYLVGADFSEVVSVAFDGPTINDFSYTLVDSTPRIVATIFKDRMFYTRESNPDRLYFTDIGDLATTDAESFIDVEGDDYSGITALIPFNDVLFIFKQNTIWTLYANGLVSNWTLRLSDSSLGAINRRCVSIQSNILYFIDKFGVYFTDGVAYEPVGQPVTDPLIASENEINDGFLVKFRDNLLINLTGETTDTIYYFDTSLRSWAEWDVPDSVKNLKLVEGKYYFGYSVADTRSDIFYLDDTVSTDASINEGSGDAITTTFFNLEFRTKLLNFGSNLHKKRIRFSYIDFVGQKLYYRMHNERIDESQEWVEIDIEDSANNNELDQLLKIVTPTTVRKLAMEFRIPAETVADLSGSAVSGSVKHAQVLAVGSVYDMHNISVSDSRAD